MPIKQTVPTNSGDYLQAFEYRDGKLFWKSSGKEAGWNQGAGYKGICLNYKKYLVHRIIFAMFHGYMPTKVDHIDGNKLNNKIENLREANVSQNAMNQKIRQDNTSGIKNVSWDKNRDSWVVRITKNKKVYQWYEKSLELAELLASEARLKYHREFANHGN